MLFAEQVITEKVILELIAFVSLLVTNIFQMWQNNQLKNRLVEHDAGAKVRQAQITSEVKECKGEICKVVKPE